MLGTYTYHEIFRRSVVAFGTLFNNIELRRNDEVMKVPLSYGPKAKFLARLDQVPDPTNKRVQLTLPRISFEINGLEYDSSRKVSPTQKIKIAALLIKTNQCLCQCHIIYHLRWVLYLRTKMIVYRLLNRYYHTSNLIIICQLN